MGTITRDGILRYLGRKDDMMMLNGINIFPAEIERTLEEHPAVKHAAAFPLASPVFGDIPAAAVELNGTAPVDEPALIAYSRERLGARAPRSIVIVDALPRNARGKGRQAWTGSRARDAPQGSLSIWAIGMVNLLLNRALRGVHARGPRAVLHRSRGAGRGPAVGDREALLG